MEPFKARMRPIHATRQTPILVRWSPENQRYSAKPDEVGIYAPPHINAFALF
jgi:hypothetical protein